jgi:uncharacterized protein YjlB
MKKLEDEIRAVVMPEYDPVYGKDGPLVTLWREATRENKL